MRWCLRDLRVGHNTILYEGTTVMIKLYYSVYFTVPWHAALVGSGLWHKRLVKKYFGDTVPPLYCKKLQLLTKGSSGHVIRAYEHVCHVYTWLVRFMFKNIRKQSIVRYSPLHDRTNLWSTVANSKSPQLETPIRNQYSTIILVSRCWSMSKNSTL